MESRAKSGGEVESEKPAPLIELIEEPQTKTSPRLKKVNPLEKTALDLEDSSVLDLSIYKIHPTSTSQPIVLVHIRSFKEDIGELLKVGKEKVSYIFRGLTPADLKRRFEEALTGLKYDSFTQLKAEVFKYEYSIAHKTSVYSSAKLLSKTLCN